VFYDVQLVAVLSFIGETERMLWYLDRCASRLLGHVADDGSMPHELRRPICEHYQMFNLQAWSIISRLGQSLGRNPWERIGMVGSNVSALCRAVAYAIPSFRMREKCKNDSAVENVKRWWPLLVDA
jgi:hypothetical protein